MPPPASHRPQASETAGRPGARRCCGQRVQEGVGGGVVGLAGAAEHAGRRGEQHERVEVEVPGQLVQVPRGVDLGPQHRVQPLGRQRREHAVVQDAGGVHDARSAVAAARSGRRAAPAVGRRRRRPRDLGAQLGQFGDELGGAAAAGTAAAGQQQCRTPCSVTRCRATSRPSAPVPPVISTVPSGSSVAAAPRSSGPAGARAPRRRARGLRLAGPAARQVRQHPVTSPSSGRPARTGPGSPTAPTAPGPTPPPRPGPSGHAPA